MYPTDNPPSDNRLSNARSVEQDIQALTNSIEDANHKPYLKQTLIDSLQSLGHSAEAATEGVNRYYKVALQ